MDNDSIAARLFRAETLSYGDKYIDHLLEQYKLYVEGMDKVSDRRQKTNEFFLTLNTALVGLLGYIDAKFGVGTRVLVFLGPIAGMLLSYFWFAVIRSYRDLNTGKFKVIHAIEGRLPLALYDTEWEALGRGKDKQRYHPITHIEIWIPWIFLALYAVVLAINIPWSSIHCSCAR